MEKALNEVMWNIEINVNVVGGSRLHKHHLKIWALQIDGLAFDVIPEHRTIRDEEFEDLAKLTEAYGAKDYGYWQCRNCGHEPSA